MKKYRLIVKMAGVLFLAGLPARGQKILEVPGQQEKAKAWGRGVIGKVVLPAAAQGKVQWSTGAAKLQKNVPPPPLPGNWKSMNNSQRRAWFMQWLKTPAGQAYKREARPYTTNFANDGALRFEGVRTGTYRLLVKVVNASGETLGTSQRIVNVPKGLGGPKAPPIDMGTIVLKIQKGLKVGDPAPDFQVKSLDGSPIRLADYKGKVVLLDFWATWCGPCRRETPHLKAVYDAFGKDPRFVIIGLSLDPNPKAPKQYVQKKGLKWVQGFLGQWSRAKVPDAYGVRGIPSIFLIGSDGRIVAKNLRGPRIKTAVAQALDKK